MYKDYKKNESLDTGFVGGSGIIWMFSGVVLGLVVGFGMYYFSNNNASALSMAGTVEEKIRRAQISQPKPPINKPSQTQQINTLKTPKTATKQEERKHKFSYYAVLPKIDVPVSSSRPINTDPGKKIATTTSVEKTTVEVEHSQILEDAIAKRKAFKKENIGDYLLQVASFKKESSANITQGKLSKRGVDAYVEAKKVRGRMWYRVLAGPVDQNSVSNWKHTAEKLGHRPLIISVR